MDLFDKLENKIGPIGEYAEYAKGYFIYPKLEGPVGPRMKFQGKEMVVWSINDYLGLASNPKIKEIDRKAAAKWGLAYPMGSQLMTGRNDHQEALEQELADFEQKEDVLLLNFGYQGFMSVIDCILDRRDVVVYDADNHACLMDGIRLHIGKRFKFNHNDIVSCEKQLSRATEVVNKTGGSILVITEGVFGMRGEQGILKEIVALKGDYDFRLMVDDAHGFGTMGATGMGTGEEQGVQDEIDIYLATFAKSMATIGAFVATTKKVRDFIEYNARSQVFAKSLPVAIIEGARARLRMVRSMPELKEKLWKNTFELRDGLRDRGFDIGNPSTNVTPVFMRGSLEEGLRLVQSMRDKHGVFCSFVTYPGVPQGMMLLRMIPTVAHSTEDIKITLDAFSAVREELRRHKQPSGFPELLRP